MNMLAGTVGSYRRWLSGIPEPVAVALDQAPNAEWHSGSAAAVNRGPWPNDAVGIEGRLDRGTFATVGPHELHLSL